MLGLAGFMDVFEVARDPFGIAADSCKNLYGWVPERYKRHNFGRMVERNLKTGKIEKVIKKGEVYLRLTSSGQEKIKRDFPIVSLQNQKWDKKWRIVIFDIAEVSRRTRDLLRLKLKELGFGMLQESVWLTPYDFLLDFREFLKEKELGDFVYAMEVSHLLAGDSQALVNRIWKLNKLNEEYETLLGKIKELKQMYIKHNDRVKEYQAKMIDKMTKKTEQGDSDKKISEGKVFQRKRDKMIKDLREKYLGIMLNDPSLPKEILPKNWLGGIVKKEIFRLRN